MTKLAPSTPRRANGDLIPFTNAQLITFGNKVADRYIRAVDEFLGSHPGAKPTLGTRNYVLDYLGLANDINHPWCATWADFVHNKISTMPTADYGAAFAFGIVEVSLEFHRVQWNKSSLPIAGIQIQHNWITVQSAGYPALQTKTKAQLDGESVIYFDPWWDLSPRVRRPGDHQYRLTDWYPIPDED